MFRLVCHRGVKLFARKCLYKVRQFYTGKWAHDACSREGASHLRRLLERSPSSGKHLQRQLPHLGAAAHGDGPRQHHGVLAQEGVWRADFQLQGVRQLLPRSYLLRLQALPNIMPTAVHQHSIIPASSKQLP